MVVTFDMPLKCYLTKLGHKMVTDMLLYAETLFLIALGQNAFFLKATHSGEVYERHFDVKQ